MKDLDELMMESFIEVVDEIREAKRIKHVDFVTNVWPESPERSAVARWHGMRTTVNRTGKPQGVLITDAQRMAEALDEDIAYLFFQASMLTKKKVALATPSPKRGRPRKMSEPTKEEVESPNRARPARESVSGTQDEKPEARRPGRPRKTKDLPST